MSLLRISTWIGADAETVYGLLKKFEEFPKLMPQVQKAKVLWRLPPNRQVSEWAVEIEGAIIHLKQEDTFDDEHRTLTFRVIEGDYRAEGCWKIGEVTTSKSKI